MTLKEQMIKSATDKLIKGEDYRMEVLRLIEAEKLEFLQKFREQIVIAKKNGTPIDCAWFEEFFLAEDCQSIEDIIIYAGLNNKTVRNMCGTTRKKVVMKMLLDYFRDTVKVLKKWNDDPDSGPVVTTLISNGHDIVELDRIEDALVQIVITAKAAQLRGGAWSTAGKQLEKPLGDALCKAAGVLERYIDNSTFKKDKSKGYDREVDYKLINRYGRVYRLEIKLTGKGNPESADATMARDTDILIAYTLSEQAKNQLRANNIKFLELSNNPNIVSDFRAILRELDIPYDENNENGIKTDAVSFLFVQNKEKPPLEMRRLLCRLLLIQTLELRICHFGGFVNLHYRCKSYSHRNKNTDATELISVPKAHCSANKPDVSKHEGDHHFYRR